MTEGADPPVRHHNSLPTRVTGVEAGGALEAPFIRISQLLDTVSRNRGRKPMKSMNAQMEAGSG